MKRDTDFQYLLWSYTSIAYIVLLNNWKEYYLHLLIGMRVIASLLFPVRMTIARGEANRTTIRNYKYQLWSYPKIQIKYKCKHHIYTPK